MSNCMKSCFTSDNLNHSFLALLAIVEVETKAASDRLGYGVFEQDANSMLAGLAFEPEPDAVELRLGGDQLDIDAHDLEL